MPDVSRGTSSLDLVVRDLGRMPYADAFALQKTLQQEVIQARAQTPPTPTEGGEERAQSRGYLFLVEHDPPVITVSRRKTARQHLVATDEQLAAAGVEVVETDRGGDITYHGPGQLVVYPILDLNALDLRLHGYMRLLEDVVIETLALYGIEGRREDGATGVWVPQQDTGTGTSSVTSKICAMGVRITRWVSMHGLALNVSTNLDHFNLIVPCGLIGRQVTSMQQLLGDACPSMDDVKDVVVEQFRSHATRHGATRPGSSR